MSALGLGMWNSGFEAKIGANPPAGKGIEIKVGPCPICPAAPTAASSHPAEALRRGGAVRDL